MADPIYYTQIKQKIAQFEREKEQVQAHLALVERRIALLHQALDVMNISEDEVHQHNTEHFKYRVYHKRFNGKLSQLIQQVMKAEPHRSWRAEEITEAVLVADKQAHRPITKDYIESVRSACERLARREIIERVEVVRYKVIQWKWKQR